MGSHSTEISVPARWTEFPRLVAATDAWAAAAGFAGLPVQRLQLALEELFTNTLEHGFGAENDSRVSLALSMEGSRLTLRYRDAAPPFDTSLTRPQVPDELRVGGYGLNVLRTMAHAFRYRRVAGANETEIEFLL
ncbi:MAG: ATP-binding protein [Azonexus sp.]|jgi:anti-sigma regulatory factor (Ser/Thr protein kinase)|nr:ATP-binding protein [Betaproteobacteria bacterium]MBK8917846.1 ATP-binding protein [Betaproteobacteria bacterium]MBP6035933.1 ATP-binding protein [Azonexus sp.]MBP6906249.1 ATP-binding protein [Azonexus sp.]